MINKQKVLVLGMMIMMMWLPMTAAFGQTTDDNNNTKLIEQTRQYWDELLHYCLIGRWDLAQDRGRALLDLEPDPTFLLNLAQSDKYADSYRNLSLLEQDTPVKDIALAVMKLVEQGRFIERTKPDRIAEEVKRLSGTTRGREMALNRLKDSGEWAVPVMIEALRDSNRSEEFSLIKWALPQLGRVAVNPLVLALQRCKELNVRLIILESLGEIGYQSAVPYIQEIVENENAGSELRTAALKALRSIRNQDNLAGKKAAAAFEQLALDYYSHLDSLAVPAEQEQANVWFWNDETGLVPEEVISDSFDELMAMRCCESAIKLDRNRATAISLWLSAFSRLEAEGHPQPAYFGEGHADAATYALTAGPEYLHRVLNRALENRNRPVALSAIKALRRNSGQKSLLFELGTVQPLMKALTFADREVRLSAALAIGAVKPSAPFNRSKLVMPILVEALRQKGQRNALIVDGNEDRRNRLRGELVNSGLFSVVVSEAHLGVTIERAKNLSSFDLIVLSSNISQPNLNEALATIANDYRLAFCPTIVITSAGSISTTEKNIAASDFAQAVLEDTPVENIIKAALEILAKNQAIDFDAGLADKYATDAAEVLRNLAVTDNKVLSLKPAEPALIEAIRETRPAIQKAAIEAVANLDSLEGQRTIAALALEEQQEMPIRLMALENLTVSAKSFGNLLLPEQVTQIYNLVSSQDTEPQLRNLAAEAFGSLNLPSTQTSKLIIDQMQ